jgi:hypothetical protein
LTVDLVAQTIAAAGQPTIHFDVEPRRKADLLDGVDEINRTMREERSINAFETRHRQAQPWIGEITIACCDVQLADHRVGFLHQNFRATPKFGPLPATFGKNLTEIPISSRSSSADPGQPVPLTAPLPAFPNPAGIAYPWPGKSSHSGAV